MLRTIMFAVLVLFPVSGAVARDGSWQIGDNQIHLVYSDVDMRTPAGRAIMLARADQAAHRLCQQSLGIDRKACITDVLSQATSSCGGHPLAVALMERAAMVNG